VYGAPLHIGLPEDIGIEDLGKPDYGDAIPIEASNHRKLRNHQCGCWAHWHCNIADLRIRGLVRVR